MMRFLLRFVGYVLLAAGFVTLVIDGARSIANSALLLTPLGEALVTVLARALPAVPALRSSAASTRCSGTRCCST